MQLRPLRSDIHISEISLGCMSLPPSLAAKDIVHTAIAAGINYFDTADLYDHGTNEEILGHLLKPHRKDIILATKVGNKWHPTENSWSWDASPSYIQSAVKESLRRLKTDYIDVYQLHGGTTEDNLEEVIDTFESLQKEGLIRAYGISSIRPNVFIPFLQNSNAITHMVEYNALNRRAEEWFTQIEATNASVVTRGTIAKGLLTNEYKERMKPYMSYNESELQQLLPLLHEHYGDLHAFALAFNLQHSSIASTVIGARTKEQLLANIAAYEKARDIKDLSFANEHLKLDVYTEHR